MDSLQPGEIEVLFEPASAPKRYQNVKSVYTKGQLICVSFTDSDLLLKWPLYKIFQIASLHQPHQGSTKRLVKNV